MFQYCKILINSLEEVGGNKRMTKVKLHHKYIFKNIKKYVKI